MSVHHLCSAHRSKKILKLALQAVFRPHVVLGIELWSPGRAACAVNWWAISLAPTLDLFIGVPLVPFTLLPPECQCYTSVPCNAIAEPSHWPLTPLFGVQESVWGLKQSGKTLYSSGMCLSSLYWVISYPLRLCFKGYLLWALVSELWEMVYIYLSEIPSVHWVSSPMSANSVTPQPPTLRNRWHMACSFKN